MRAGSREAVALWRSLCHTGLAARMLSSELEMYPMIAVAPEMAMVRTAGSISAGFVLLSALETHFPVSETPRPLTSPAKLPPPLQRLASETRAFATAGHFQPTRASTNHPPTTSE